MRPAGALEIEMVGRQQRARALIEDVRAPARSPRGVGIGVVRPRLGGDGKLRSLDALRVRLGEKEAAVIVVADQPDRLDEDLRVELLQVDRHVAAGPAAVTLLCDDLGEAVLARPVLDQLVVVAAPCAGRHYAFARRLADH